LTVADETLRVRESQTSDPPVDNFPDKSVG
jgi:hypothetical protein